jgi:hypothetical protein
MLFKKCSFNFETYLCFYIITSQLQLFLLQLNTIYKINNILLIKYIKITIDIISKETKK